MRDLSTILLPTAASLLLTEDCNLRCTYCFEKHKTNKMTKEVARKALEYLCENAIKNGDNTFSVMIFGGEPLLNVPVFEEIFKYGTELARKYKIKFTANMVTNGTILTDKIKKIIKTYMKETEFHVQVSVDGIKEIHDKYRVTKAGNGSFDMIEKNIEGWKELFKDNIMALSVHGCSNHDTLPHLFENYKFFREIWGIPRIWFIPIHSDEWVQDDVRVYKEELEKIYDYVINRIKIEGRIDEAHNYAPLDRGLWCSTQFNNAPCGAGKNFVTVTANGDIYPCHAFYFNDPEATTKIGDIYNGIDEPRRAIFREYDNNDLSCSKDNPSCDCYNCYRCIADNWMKNGTIFSVIRGIKCQMAHVERSLQNRLKEDLTKMGLFNQNNKRTNSNDACLCNLRTYDGDPNYQKIEDDCLCDSRGNAVESISKCDCKGKCGTTESDTNELIAAALNMILDKLDNMNGQVDNNSSCDCKGKCDTTKPNNNELIISILNNILDKLDTMDKQQVLILKKLL